MISLYDILEYITSAPTLLLFGAGPSCEIGIPDCKLLAAKVLTEVNIADKPILQQAKLQIRNGDLPAAFETIGSAVGYDRLYNTCKSLLKDPGVIGKAFTALAQLPFHGYLTTNYEDIFLRHLEANQRAVTIHKNNKHAIEQVDFDAVTTLVKLHSDFDDTDTIILSDSQYKAAQFSNDFQYLREFLKSQVLTRHILIVGYSVNDPDISLILQEATRILRRKVPIYAIVANADPEKAREWELTYNIQIFSYENTDGTHSQLVRLLDLLLEYSGIRSGAKPALGESELKDAQHLYMWHRLRFQNEEESIQGALDSLILGILSEQKTKEISFVTLKASTSRFLSGTANEETLLNRAIENLQKLGYVRGVGDTIQMLPSGKAEAEKHSGQFLRLCEVFREQVKLDCKSEFTSVSRERAMELADTAFNSIVDLFKERAVELFEALFRENPIGVPPSLGMFRLLHRHALAFSDFSERAWLIRYCTRILKNPKNHEAELLSYLARAFYCFQALQLDPEGFVTRTKVLLNRMCLVDSNVIIPCIADGHPGQPMYLQAFGKAHSLGLKFQVLDETVEEIERAAKWALDLVKDTGEKSIHVLSAASGEAGFRPNQFLQAYIESVGDKPIRFRAYLEGIFGKALSVDSIALAIQKKLLIPTCKTKDIIHREDDKIKEFRKKVKEEIQRRSSESYFPRPKTRMEIEATVYTIIAFWNELRKNHLDQERCCFISLGGTLNWLAKSSAVAINRTPVMTLDGLYEVIRLMEQPEGAMSFFDWIKGNYFPAAASMLKSRAARKFFIKIIEKAEEEYINNLESFNEALDQKLSKGYIEEIPDLEKPLFVQSLAMRRTAMAASIRQEKVFKEKVAELERVKDKALRTAKYWKQQATLLSRKKAKKKK